MSKLINVLIADDHSVVRSGLTSVINKMPNFKVIFEAENGTEAFMGVEKNDIDIVVMDLSMPPGENGLVTTKRLHAKYPKVAILILSMHDEQEYIDAAIHNGALGYVLKNSPDSELIRGIKTVAAGKVFIDVNITLNQSDLDEMDSNQANTELYTYETLSKREREVLPLIALGYSNKELAAKLFITTKTVEAHKANIMRKLGLTTHVELVYYAVHHHLIEF